MILPTLGRGNTLRDLGLPKRRDFQGKAWKQKCLGTLGGLQGLKIVRLGKRGGRERVPVLRNHRYKLIVE